MNSKPGNRILEEDDYSTLDRLSLALNRNEPFENGSFTLCFWVYFLKSNGAGVVIRQGRPNAFAAIPFLTIDGDGFLTLFPSPPPPDTELLEAKQSNSIQVKSSQTCQTEKWIHVGCELGNEWTRIYLNTSLVAESDEWARTNENFQPSVETVLLSGGDGSSSGGNVRAYVHYARLLPRPSVTNHFVKNPPYELNLVGASSHTEDDVLEDSGDGVWNVVGGKASCRRNFALDVILVDALGRSVDRDFDINASLIFDDDGTVVERMREDAESPLLTTVDGVEYPAVDRPMKLIHGRASFKLKISQLSSKCDNRLFRVSFNPLNTPNYPFLQSFSRPIRCISRNRTSRQGLVHSKRSFSFPFIPPLDGSEQTSTFGLGKPNLESKTSNENAQPEPKHEVNNENMHMQTEEYMYTNASPSPFFSFPPPKRTKVSENEHEIPVLQHPFVSEGMGEIPVLGYSRLPVEKSQLENLIPSFHGFFPSDPSLLNKSLPYLSSFLNNNNDNNDTNNINNINMNNNDNMNDMNDMNDINIINNINYGTNNEENTFYSSIETNLKNVENDQLQPPPLLPLPHSLPPQSYPPFGFNSEMHPLHLQPPSMSSRHVTRLPHQMPGGDRPTIGNPDTSSDISDKLVIDYCLGSINVRSDFLQSFVRFKSNEEIESFAQKVSKFTGCHHNGFQISIAKKLLILNEEIWKGVSENASSSSSSSSPSSVSWNAMIMHLESRLHEILSSTTRSLNDKDKEFMQRLSGCDDFISRNQFDRLWKWFYPVAVSLSSEPMKQAWHSLDPVWVIGMISREDAEAMLAKEGMKKGKFLVRFASSRLWPHPDAGALVVSFVTDEAKFSHKLLSFDESSNLLNVKDGRSMLDVLTSQRELSSICMVDSKYNRIENNE